MVICFTVIPTRFIKTPNGLEIETWTIYYLIVLTLYCYEKSTNMIFFL